jgi:hypothetical protein
VARWLWMVCLWWAERMTTAKVCSVTPRHLCEDAFNAVRSHDLRWDGNDWIVLSMTRRRATARARFYELGADGEPYTWVTCPWCGGDLPLPEGQADGS